MSTIKQLFSFLTLLLFYSFTYAQLSGVINVPANYPTLESVITAINNNGVTSPGLIVNIESGHIETFSSPTAGKITSVTSNELAPIVFQKSGSGDNPLIIAAQGVGSMDAIIMIVGGDFITFNGIDLIDPATNSTNMYGMEWGFAFLKPDNQNGCQFNTINNCTVLLHNSNYSSTGIYIANHTPQYLSDLNCSINASFNSYNSFNNNTIKNCYNGIFLKGYWGSNNKDTENHIGTEGGNSIKDFGGSYISSYAIYCEEQRNLKIANNQIKSGSGLSTDISGIRLQAAQFDSLEVTGNIIELISSDNAYGISCTASTFSSNQNSWIIHNEIRNCVSNDNLYGIWFEGISKTTNIVDNQIYNNQSSSFYGIYCYPDQLSNMDCTTQINYNSIHDISNISNSFGFTGIHFSGEGNYNIIGNQIYNLDVSVAQCVIKGLMLYNGTSISAMSIHDNSIHDFTIFSTGQSSIIGISILSNGYLFGDINNNLLCNLNITSLGSAQVTACIVLGNYPEETNWIDFHNNVIHSLTSDGLESNTMGLFIAHMPNFYINANKIYNLTSTGTQAVTTGIKANSGSGISITNNFISDLRAPGSTQNPGIIGLNLGGNTQVYYNTIFLNAIHNGGLTFSSVGITTWNFDYTDLRNNIIVNTSEHGPDGYTIAYQQNVFDTLTNYDSLSDNNCFYAGTPGPKNLIFYDGVNAFSLLSDYKLFAAPMEQHSITEFPPFINSSNPPFDLHLNSFFPSLCESGGVVIDNPIIINTDLDGQARFPNPGFPDNTIAHATAPDIGADEFAGNDQDTSGPSIVYDPLLNTSSLTDRTLLVKIEDASGIPKLLPGLPRVYWKINSGNWIFSEGVFTGDTMFSFLFGNGVNFNDTVYYYVIAQDSAVPAENVTAWPLNGASGFSANPPACTIPPQSPNFYIVSYGLRGIIQYANATQTPLAGVKVFLKDNHTDYRDSTITDIAGYYYFSDPPIADYTLLFNNDSPASGYNAVDALLALKHFVGLVILNGIDSQAANVDGNNIINAVDALLITKRFVGMSSSFPAGDWAFPPVQINYTGIPLNHAIPVRCYGDVDGSFVP